MASYSEVKAGLDEVAQIIRDKRTVALAQKDAALSNSEVLAGLATRYADVIATVQGYGTSDAAESAAKAELDKLVAEYVALKAIFDAIGAINP